MVLNIAIDKTYVQSFILLLLIGFNDDREGMKATRNEYKRPKIY